MSLEKRQATWPPTPDGLATITHYPRAPGERWSGTPCYRFQGVEYPQQSQALQAAREAGYAEARIVYCEMCDRTYY